MRFISRTLLVAAAVAAPALLQAQATEAKLDISKVAASRDSFLVMLQGQEAGYQVLATTKGPEGMTLKGDLSVMGGMQTKKDEIVVGPDNAMRSIKSEMAAQGQTFPTTLIFANGRVTGTATIPSMGGPEERKIDTTVAPGAVDAGLITSVLPTLALAQGAKFTFAAFSPIQGARNVEIEVTGSESLTIPAGTFDAWVVSLTGVGNGASYYVSKANPRVLKISPVGQPVELVLAK